jgi:hypothetical protein
LFISGISEKIIGERLDTTFQTNKENTGRQVAGDWRKKTRARAPITLTRDCADI